MRAQLRAFAFVDDALEQRAENRRIDLRPILLGRLQQRPPQIVGNRRHKIVVKQRAVEMANVPHAKRAAGRAFWRTDCAARAANRRSCRRGLRTIWVKMLSGSSPHILGKEAEEQAHQEMGQLLRRCMSSPRQLAVLFHLIGDAQEGVGRGFGDLFLRLVRRELLRVEEGPAQFFHAVARQGCRQR